MLMRTDLPVLLAMLALAPYAQTQSTFGTILGTVSDPSGGAMPQTSIEITNVSENTVRSTTTDALGAFEFLNLKPGRYKLAAHKTSFTAAVQYIELSAREAVRDDVVLQLAPAHEGMVIRGSAPIINVDNGTLGETKSFEEITRLPINYRAALSTSPLNAMLIVPGVQQDRFGRVSIGGGLPSQVEYTLDGISTVNIRFNGPNWDLFSSPEILSEFKVTEVDNSAEFGQMGDVTVSTKSGTNQFHGSAFWYHQNQALDAGIYGAPSKQQKVFNTFGASLGGPMILPRLYNGRHSTFFFADYEGNRRPMSELDQLTVPTAAMRLGDLNGVAGPRAIDPFTGAPFPGNVIPADRINATAKKLLSEYYPLPNYPSGGIVSNFRRLVPVRSDADGYDVRLDHFVSARQQIFGRWTSKTLPSRITNGLLPPSELMQWNKNLVLSHSISVRPHVINELRGGISIWRGKELFPINGSDAIANLGLQGLHPIRGVGGFPGFDFSDSTGFDPVGHSRADAEYSRTLQYTDNVSWIAGAHTWRFGLDVRQLRFDDVLHTGWGDDFGALTFTSGAFTDNAFADFLLGLPSFSEYGALGPNPVERTTHYHVYAQDHWNAGRRLTIQLGLRWDVHPPLQESSGNSTNFDRRTGNVIVPDHTIPAGAGFLSGINACPGTTAALPCTNIVTATQAGLPQALRKTDWHNLAPRVGFAFRPFASNRTVIRGGFGVFTQTMLGRAAYVNTAIHSSDVRQFTNFEGPGQAPVFVLPQVYAGQFALDQPGAESFEDAVNPTLRDPHSSQWNLTLEHQLSTNIGVRASYIGLNSVGMPMQVDLNQVHASATRYSPARKPYAVWQEIVSVENVGFSNYQGLQLEATRRFAANAFFQASYVVSKNIGSVGAGTGGGLVFPNEVFGVPITDRFNTRLDRGNLAGSRRHRFLATALVPIPFGRGQRFGANLHPAMNAVAGGWEISTITLVQTGPFQTPTIGYAFDRSNTNLAARLAPAHPDRIGDGNRENPTRDSYYDQNAFIAPPAGAGRFGNGGVGILEGPGTVAISAGLAKTALIGEKLRLRLEATFTNVPNHLNFLAPSVMVGSARFGKLTSIQQQENAGNRTGQLGVRMDF